MANIIETRRVTAGIGPDSRQILTVHLVQQDATFDTLAKRARVTIHTMVDRDDGLPGRQDSVTYRLAAAANGGPPGWTAADANAFRALVVSAFDVAS